MEKVVSKAVAEQKSSTKHDKNKVSSEISMKEFLDFLRSAYQVTDSVEDTLSSVEGTSAVIDWIKLKNTKLVKTSHVACQITEEDLGIKLEEIINEGIMDAVVPYLVPPVSSKKSLSKLSEKSISSTRATISKDSVARRSSDSSTTSKIIITKTDSEVEIHVCDEVKSVKKDFICSQKLLVEKMGYFADVTSGQKLEEMDISVHCDISIFEWLMKWVKQDLGPEEEVPRLDAQCVIPILVSAAFLQMEPLLQDCLLYCHENMNAILQNATTLSCLNDSIITRLAAMYTNTELEKNIKDKRDKIHSRLYCKLIVSLCETVCESVRGHWNSLARIYRCCKCNQLVMPEVAKILPCHPSCMYLDRYGDVTSQHVRHPEWNINHYISTLHSKLKTWRRVYWRLWGDCHYLQCSVCNTPFPAHKLKWCCYHPEPPQFFTIDSQRSPLPVGRFPCCGERAYRFQLVSNISGCQFREHVPKTSKARDAAVFAILESFRDIIETEPPVLIFPERLTRLVARDCSGPDGKLSCKETFWWDGLHIVPPRQHQGLLGNFVPKCEVPLIISPPTAEENLDESFEEDSLSTISSSSSSDDRSEESHHQIRKQTIMIKKSKKKKPTGKHWQVNLSPRSNQDLQRLKEEILLKRMMTFLTKHNPPETNLGRAKIFLRHIRPPAGIYSRLEAEWKEVNIPNALKRFFNSNKPRIRATRLV